MLSLARPPRAGTRLRAIPAARQAAAPALLGTRVPSTAVRRRRTAQTRHPLMASPISLVSPASRVLVPHTVGSSTAGRNRVLATALPDTVRRVVRTRSPRGMI